MLLVECNVLEKVEVINEGTEGNTRLRLRGKFQQCDEQNNNGRIYPRKILESQVKAIQEKIGDRSLVGALDHPANDAIHLSQASHLITGLNVDKDGSVIGECEILSTPNGKIVEALINDGVKIGISSRGVGSVTEGIKGKIVNEDFKLITFDLVSDPSTRGAFPELTESIRENSQRAQEIVTKHKKDRVLLTMLESKISEALKGKQKKLDKNKNNKIDSEDFEMLRGEKKDDDSMDEKSFPDLSGDGKVTMKDILMGRGVIKKGKKKKSMEEGSIKDDPEAFKKAKAKAKAKGQQTEMPKPPKRDVKAAVVEGLKRICWGDRYDEGDVKRMNKRRRQAMDTRAGAQRPSLATPDTARSKAYDALKGDFSRVAKSYLKAKEYGRSGEAAAARARARATGIRAPVKPKKPNNQ
tara:strand:+ start:405 stop:1637 length:1233 start_codon:yes stop_codon:yes gene_type:complete